MPDIYRMMRRLLFGLLALGLTLSCGRVTSGSGSVASTTDYTTAGAGPGGADAARAGGAATAGLGAAGNDSGGARAGAGGTANTDAGAGYGSAGSGNTSSSGPGSSTLAVLSSSGCGKDLPATQVPTIPGSRTGYTEFHVTQTGATLGADVPSDAGERQFFVRVPIDYDKSRPYRVVYIGSGCGTLQAAKINTYPLFDETQGGTEQAVYVAVSVPSNAANPGCYDNSSGAQSQEWEAFDLVHDFVESNYCVDNNRVYVAGYSTGSWLANMWGCYFAGTPSPPLDKPDVDAGRSERKFAPHWAIRGHVNVSGSLPPNQPLPCNGPAAGFWIHDQGDGANLIATNIAAFNLSLKSNGCTGDYASGPKRPWAPAEQIPGLQGGICQQYTGCSTDVTRNYPLVFCTTNDRGHGEQAERAIPAFRQFLDLLDPAP